MDTSPGTSPTTYHIRIQGSLSPILCSWFGDVHIHSQSHNETLLEGDFADQAALRGLLDQLWNLNMTVLSVTQPEMDSTPEKAGNRGCEG